MAVQVPRSYVPDSSPANAGASSTADAKPSVFIDLPPKPAAGAFDLPRLNIQVAEIIRNGDALAAQGDHAGACDCYGQAAALLPLERSIRIKLVNSATAAGRDHVAEHHLREWARIHPEDPDAHLNLAQWCLRHGQSHAAEMHMRRAVELSQGNRDIATAYGVVLEAIGQSDRAWETCQQALRTGFVTSRLASLYARLAPRHGEAERALSIVLQLLAANIAPADRCTMHFAAAELLDRLGRYDEAFAHARQGSAVKGYRYDPRLHSEFVDRQLQYFTPDKLRNLPRATHGSKRPVFIVGMPRSGTSLVEQILASHPDIQGGGELHAVDHMIAQRRALLGEQPYPTCFDRLSVSKANQLASIYLNAMDAVNPSAARVTDKMPLNFFMLGAIALLLPDARIIHCRRDPMDTCLSCYMTDFIDGHQFTYDLRGLGHVYRQHDRIMKHWKTVLELPILEVSYETLVRDPEPQLRRLVEFVGLPWDDRCLRFNENPRFVGTASYQQVRRPIYRSSVGRWRNYATHLAPLLSALEGE